MCLTRKGMGWVASAVCCLVLVLFAAGAWAATTLVSVSSSGVQGNNWSFRPSVSSTGRYVAFVSYSTNLVAGDTNGAYDVYVRDMVGGTTTRASVSSDGTGADYTSYQASISGDGRYVAFTSAATNLVSGDTNGADDVFVHDCQTGTTTRVSVASDGTQGNSDSRCPSLSANGRYVAFLGYASNLVTGDTNGATDVFVHDRQTGETTRVSVASDGTQGNGSADEGLSLSSDGRYVAFASSASNLVTDDTNGREDIFTHDRETGATTRVSVASDGTQADRRSLWPAISADGRYVAFLSEATNLVAGDTNGYVDVFVHDAQTGATERVCEYWDFMLMFVTDGPAISASGRYVAVLSNLSTLVPDDTNSAIDVFRVDRQTGDVVRVSVGPEGAQANSGSEDVAISADGAVVGFSSWASNLVANDTNGDADAFVSDAVVNHAPTAPVVEVTPALPRTSDDLTCGITTESTDEDSDTVTYSYAWYKDTVRQGDYDDETTVPSSATAAGETWKCVVTPNDGTEDGPTAEDEVTVVGAPSLAWLGRGEYTTDGVDPGSGAPEGADTPTDFTFKVQYTDPSGHEPQIAALKVQRLVDDANGLRVWERCDSFAMTLESGDVTTGAVYTTGAVQLPEEIVRHRFRFVSDAGGVVAGDPNAWLRGPQVSGCPRLFWAAKTGYETDGVDPDTGALGDRFRFQVRYACASGLDPVTAVLVVRRNGNALPEKALTAQAGGDLCTGKLYATWLVFSKPGTYEYRFRFENAVGEAVGEPAQWQDGPALGDGAGGALVTALSSVPTAAGAQVTFALTGAAEVTAEVMNAAGRPIRTIAVDRPCDAGVQTLLWDRRAGTGLRVPTGMYLVRVTARTVDGGQSTALASMAVR